MASKANLIFKEEVFKTMGAAMDVHRILGPGFLEPVYQEALVVELIRQEVPFKAQCPLKIRYRDGFLEKRYLSAAGKLEWKRLANTHPSRPL